jgi:hypothetical protein
MKKKNCQMFPKWKDWVTITPSSLIKQKSHDNEVIVFIFPSFEIPTVKVYDPSHYDVTGINLSI